jgi:3-hydroxybutyryl-CoA dehydrogenase
MARRISSNIKRRSAVPAAELPVGVIGLGLMGHSIIACLLAAGHPVTGLSRDLRRHRGARRHIRALLDEMKREGLLNREPSGAMDSLRLTEDYRDLAACRLVLESVIEDVETKQDTYRAIEEVVAPDAIIGTNTSSIPVSILQAGAVHPERFVGIHWDEPAHVTRFLEIIVGERSDPACAERIRAMASRWGKEPSVLRRDIRGFITNRVSYAMFREACHLVDSGVCTVEDVDRSLRNDVGWWMPFAGPFRYMDLMGVQGYHRVMQDLLPELCASPEVPPLIRRVVESGGRGVSNGQGFYRYTEKEAKRWERAFVRFNYEIRRLALKHPSNLRRGRTMK